MPKEVAEDDQEWIVRQNGEVFGLFGLGELQALAAAGRLRPDDHVADAVTENWQPARTVPGLSFTTAAPSSMGIPSKHRLTFATDGRSQISGSVVSSTSQTDGRSVIEKPWVILASMLCLPVGLVFVWMHRSWSRNTKLIWTGCAGVVVLIALVSPDKDGDAPDGKKNGPSLTGTTPTLDSNRSDQRGKWGFIDKTGRAAIEFEYDYADDFSEGLAVAKKGGRFGYIDKRGKTQIDFQYDQTWPFVDGLASVYQGGQSFFIDKTGKRSECKVYEVVVGKRWGLKDDTGRYLVNPQFDFMFRVAHDLWIVGNGEPGGEGEFNQSGLMNATGELVLPLRPGMLVPLPGVRMGENHRIRLEPGDPAVIFTDPTTKLSGFLDRTGRVVVPAKFLPTPSARYSEGLVPVLYRTGPITFRAGFVDKSGSFVIEPQFDGAGSFSEGFAAVEFIQPGEGRSKWGYIDKTGRLVIEPQFAEAHEFSDGLACVKVSEKYGFIDKAGKMVIAPQFDHDSRFSEGLAAVRHP